MSLIEEALRKQQQGHKDGPLPVADPVASRPELVLRQTKSGPPAEAQPTVPTPTGPVAQNEATLESEPDNHDADASTQQAPDAKPAQRSSWPIVLLVLLFLFAGGVWGIRTLWILHRSSGDPPAAPVSGSVVLPESEPVATAPAVKPELLPPDVSVSDTPESPVAVFEDPSPTTEPVVPVQVAKKDQPSAPVGAVESSVPVKELDPRPVVWPALQLRGVLEQRGSRRGSAFLNGEVVEVGESILGVTVVEVIREGVRLRYADEIRFLRVGGFMEQVPALPDGQR